MKKIILWLIVLMAIPVFSAAGVQHAKPRDLAQTNEFLSGLPSACDQSWMDVSDDGTVNVHIICRAVGDTPSMNKVVRTKDNVVQR